MRLELPGLNRAFVRVCAQLLLVAFVLVPVGRAEPGSDSGLAAPAGHCAIEFFATSTKRNFSGSAEARPFSLTRHESASGESMWWSASVEIVVTDLDTGWEERDHDMYWMFDSKEFPRIVADFQRIDSEGYELARLGAAPRLDFDLTIRDVTRRVSAKVLDWARNGEHASFNAEFDVSTSSFKLHVPTLLGFLRVGDIVKVRAHIELDHLPEVEPAPQGSS